jgi:predicted Fe-S protein YdhL (DUF1289 family)
MSNQTIKTPCIGLCSTVFGDLICRGCKRFHYEIIQWNGYTYSEKTAIWLRLETLLVQVMLDKVVILSAELLREQLETRRIRYFPNQSAYCWAYQLIARGAENIVEINAYGVDLLPRTKDLPLAELRKQIDKEFFILSEAHYHRYIAPSFLSGTWNVNTGQTGLDQ